MPQRIHTGMHVYVSQCIDLHLDLHLGHLTDAFSQSEVHLSEERETTLYCCRYSKEQVSPRLEELQ